MVCAIVSKFLLLIADSGLSVYELAFRAGVSTGTIYRIRKGELVRSEKFARVCKVLKVKPSELIDVHKLERLHYRFEE